MCDCSQFSLASSGDLSKSAILEFGPAYDDYKSGQFNPNEAWRNNAPIPTWILPSCCYDKPFEGFIWKPSLHATLMVFWLLAVAGLAVGIHFNGDLQPLRYRQRVHLYIFLINLTLLYLFNIINVSADLTGSPTIILISLFVNAPILLWYYIFNIVHLAIAYSRSFYMSVNDLDKVKVLSKLNLFATSTTFLIGVSALAFVGIMSVIGLSVAYPVYSVNNLYESIRCSWWSLPSQYTQPTTIDQPALCDCVHSIWNTDPELEIVCGSSFFTACINSTTEADDVQYDYSSICQSCLADQDESQCNEDMFLFMTSQLCGYPSLMPHFATCDSGIGSIPSVTLSYAVYAFFLLSLVAVGSIAVSTCRDELIVKYESVAMTAVGVPMFALVFATLIDIDFRASFNSASTTYPVPIIFLHAGCWFCLLISVALPLGMTLSWQLESQRLTMVRCSEVADSHVRLHVHTEALSSSSSDGSSPTGNFDKGPSFSALLISIPRRASSLLGSDSVDRKTRMDGPIEALSNDPTIGKELLVTYSEICFALENSDAGKLYLDFSWREFSAESFLFLKACRNVFIAANSSHRLSSLAPQLKFDDVMEASTSGNERASAILLPESETFEKHLIFIIENFLKVSAEFEVNIQSSVRKQAIEKLCSILGIPDTPFTSNQRLSLSLLPSIELQSRLTKVDEESKDSHLVSPDEKGQAIAIISPVIREVTRLIASDSWLRFRSSTLLYDQFKKLYDSEQSEKSSMMN